MWLQCVGGLGRISVGCGDHGHKSEGMRKEKETLKSKVCDVGSRFLFGGGGFFQWFFYLVISLSMLLILAYYFFIYVVDSCVV